MQLTKEGLGYLVIWLVLFFLGLQQQVNLILLTVGLAVGPIVGSVFVSASTLWKLRASRRAPSYVFSGEVLTLDYTLFNDRRWTAALAMTLNDAVAPVDRIVSGSSETVPKIFFPRVPGRDRLRLRWQGNAPNRGRYRFGAMELATRSPFGLLERRLTIEQPGSFIVYPAVGKLSRRWQIKQREAAETRRGRRHDRSSQQMEYHGLREYRPGDSPRWIHWRTTARLGKPMVKEFEQQQEQDLTILLDPWLPRTKVDPARRETLESSIRFVASLCTETCRHQGRRILLGITGASPIIRQGPASIKLLHELLEQLAILRASSEGHLSSLFDSIPTSVLRDSLIIVVATRPVNLIEESERSARLSGIKGRGLAGRVVVLDASRGDLNDLIEFDRPPAELAPSDGLRLGETGDEAALLLEKTESGP